MLGEIRAMQVYTYYVKYICMNIIAKKPCYVNFCSILMYKNVLCKLFWTGSKIRAMRIRAMKNRAS